MKFDLEIEETSLNKKIYPQLIRQLDILKWLCSKNDNFCTMDKHIQFLDKIFNVFNGTKKDYFEAKKLNERKQQYYLNKFVFRQDVDLDGKIVTKTHNEFNEKVKEKINVDADLAGKITFYDYY